MRLCAVCRAADSGSTIIYGIGNHQFPNTKHSLGQLLVEALAAKAARAAGRTATPHFAFDKALHAMIYTLDVPIAAQAPSSSTESSCMIFMKSKYPMNWSGYSIAQLIKKDASAARAIRNQMLFIAHDELSLPAAKYGFRTGGSAKGHNGLRDIVAKLKTENFHRIRIGIGRPDGDSDKKRVSTMSIADWCLSAATREEMGMCTSLESPLVEAAWNYIEQQRTLKEIQ